MKNLNLIIGLLVAAALAAGVYYAEVARDAAGEAPPVAAEPPVASPGAEIVEGQVPDVTLEDGTFRVADLLVRVEVPRRPIKAYEERAYRFHVTDVTGAPVTLDGGVVKFNMSMDMGRHHYALVGEGDGWYGIKAPIPMCPSGKVRWHGNMELTLESAVHKGGFQFDIEP